MSIGKALSKGKRVWVISSIDGRVEQLRELHRLISDKYHTGDALVYTGNIFGGIAENITKTIDEILFFRRRIMAGFETENDSICYIRGAYEDMLFKLFNLNFDNKPAEKYAAMMNSGLKCTLISYGIDPEKGSIAADQGSVQLLNFIENLKSEIKRHDGHSELLFSKSLVNYVYAEDKSLLILSAGLDRQKPIDCQKEEIAYGTADGFYDVNPYDGYKTVIRGKAFDIDDDGVFADAGFITINPVSRLYAMLFDEKGKPDTLVKI